MATDLLQLLPQELTGIVAGYVGYPLVRHNLWKRILWPRPQHPEENETLLEYHNQRLNFLAFFYYLLGFFLLAACFGSMLDWYYYTLLNLFAAANVAVSYQIYQQSLVQNKLETLAIALLPCFFSVALFFLFTY